MSSTALALSALLAFPLLATSGAQDPPPAPHLAALPPAPPWSGRSRELVVSEDDPWITPCERSGLVDSPPYDETIEWLERIVAAAPELEMVTIGRSLEGRDVWMVIASGDGAFTPEALRATGKPILLAQAGIHSGEIDGKDAGMMLLRDMTVRGTKRELLEGASFLFVPILSVDGHERRSPFGRINQRGPREIGWRTNSRNLNLNRDYAKLDTEEIRAVVEVISEWRPDLYFDLHVTDGMDYQYDITTDAVGPHGYSPSIARWMQDALIARIDDDLRRMGHVPGPMISEVARGDLSKGIVKWTGGPRFSNSYGDARHLPTLLVENHSLKPYDQRVLGTYVLLESALRLLAERKDELREAIERDRKARPAELPLSWRVPDTPPRTIDFLGIESEEVPAPVSGGTRIAWNGRPMTVTIPWLLIDEPVESVAVPKAYWIPPSWPRVIERLERHGIEVQRIAEGRDVAVEVLHLENAKLGERPFEGHVTVTCEPRAERRTQHFPAGSVRVSTDQPLGDLVVLLLEPRSQDSFLQWGFFLEVLQQTEYFESYVMEPLAERMLAEDEQLAREFEQALEADSALACNPRARLEWFYRRTPYFDERWNLYPVAREW